MTPDQAKTLLRRVVEQTLSPGPVPHPRRVELTTNDGTASDVGHALQLLTKEGLAGEELRFWDEAFHQSLASLPCIEDADDAGKFADEAVRERRKRMLEGVAES